MKKRTAIVLCLIGCLLLILAGCGGSKDAQEAVSFDSLKSEGKVELSYAEMFEAEKFQDGYYLLTIADEDKFLLVPEGAPVPDGLDESIKVIRQPITGLYVAASSSIDFFRQLDALSSVRMTSTEESDWSFEDVQKAIESEELLYVGKYSAPDYETIVAENCGLAIESTMIYHSPDIKEKLETMGIPVMVEHSSYEAHPLGRMEWIKLYGILTGKEAEADAFFEQEVKKLDGLLTEEPTDKKVAFFYVSSAGYINVRKPGDYISKMIEMAGGKYVLSDMKTDEENALSTMNMQMEEFYSRAQDADILIYNSTIEGNLDRIDQLVEKNKLFADFKAVKSGNVWCTGSNMFQQTTGVSQMIVDLHSIIHDDAGEGADLTFLHKMK